MFNNTLATNDGPVGAVFPFGLDPEVFEMDYLYPNWIQLTINAFNTELALSVVKLWKAGEVVLGPNTVVADLDAAECDFSGYAPVNLTTWKGPYNADGGGQYVETGLVIFTASAGSPFLGNTVGGYWIENSGGNLWFAGTFDSEFPISEYLDSCQFNVQVPYGVPVSNV